MQQTTLQESIRDHPQSKRVLATVERTEVETSEELEANFTPEDSRDIPTLLSDERTDVVKSDMITNQSIINQVELLDESTTEVPIVHSKTDVASVDYRAHSAKVTSEITASEHETAFTDHPKSVKHRAIPTTDSMKGIEVSVIQTSEKEQPLQAARRVSTVQAQQMFTESRPIQVTEVVTESTSDKYYPELVVATEVASKSVVEQKPYDCLEPYISEKENILQPASPIVQSKAEIQYELQESKEISSIFTHDKETELISKSDIKPVSVNSDFTEHIPLQVTSQETSEMESPLTIINLAETREAKSNQEHPLTTAITEEVLTSLTTDTEIVHRQRVEVQAQLLNDEFEQTDVSQVTVLEKVSEFEQDDKPAQFTAARSHTEHRSVVVESHQLPEHEDVLKQITPIQNVAIEQLMDGNKSIVVQTVEPLTTVKDIRHIEHITGQASVSRDHTQETTTSETHIFEGTSELLPIQKQFTTANMSVGDIERSIVITEIESAEKENTFNTIPNIEHQIELTSIAQVHKPLTREEVQSSQTVSDLIPLHYETLHVNIVDSISDQSIDVVETHPYDETQEIEQPKRLVGEQASPAVNVHKPLSVTIQESIERESILTGPSKAHQMYASTIPTHALHTTSVEETIAAQSTGIIENTEQTKQTARLTSTGLESSQVSVVLPYDTTESVHTYEASTWETAHVVSPDQLGTCVEEPVVYDSLSEMKMTLIQDKKNARLLVDELKSVIVEDIQYEDKERDLNTVPTATTEVTGCISENERQLVITQEVNTIETAKTFSNIPQLCEKAIVDITKPHVTNVHDITTYETLGGVVSDIFPKEEHAIEHISPQFAVDVQSTNTVERESILDASTYSKEQHAKYNISQTLSSAVIEETGHHGQTNEINKDARSEQFAALAYRENESFTTAHIETFDQTYVLEPIQSSREKTATISLDAHQSALISVNESVVTEGALAQVPSDQKKSAKQCSELLLNPVSVYDVEVLTNPEPFESIMESGNANLKPYNQDATHISDVIIYQSEEPLHIHATTQKNAQSQQSTPLVSAVTQEVRSLITTGDIIDQLNKCVQPAVLHSTQMSTITTDIQSFEQANILPTTTIKHNNAFANITEMSSVEQFQSTPIETLGTVTESKSVHERAKPDVDVLFTSVQSEITTKETVKSFDIPAAEQFRALKAHSISDAIVVQTVQAQVNDQLLESLPLRSEKAMPVILDLNIADQFETTIEQTPMEMASLGKDTKYAREITDSQYGVSHLETLSEEHVNDLPQFTRPVTSMAKPDVTIIEATNHIETIAAHSVKPLLEQTKIDQQATETSCTQTQHIAESYETTTSETAVVIESQNLSDETPRRASVNYDTFTNFVVEEISSTETTFDINTFSSEPHKSADLKPSEARHSVEVTEIQTSELNEDMNQEKQLECSAVLIAADNYDKANFENITVYQGRYCFVCVCLLYSFITSTLNIFMNNHLHFSLSSYIQIHTRRNQKLSQPTEQQIQLPKNNWKHQHKLSKIHQSSKTIRNQLKHVVVKLLLGPLQIHKLTMLKNIRNR